MLGQVKNQAQQLSQEVTGTVGIAIGASGTTYQLITQVMSLTVLVVNLVLGLGGIYLMRHKIWGEGHNRRKEDKE